MRFRPTVDLRKSIISSVFALLSRRGAGDDDDDDEAGCEHASGGNWRKTVSFNKDKSFSNANVAGIGESGDRD